MAGIRDQVSAIDRWGEVEFLLAPREAWLVYLARGWRLEEPLPDGLPPPHGSYSILLWGPTASDT